MRTKYKPWAKPYIEAHPEISLTDEVLSTMDNIYLEIGSGKGKFLLEMALKYPLRTFIGIERNVTCAGFTSRKLVDNDIHNAYLILANAEKVLETMKEGSAKIIYLNFSDPWPKTRHHKRRLTSEVFLSLYKKVLSSDGIIIQKTDNLDLFNFSKETYLEAGFEIIEEDRNYQLDDEDIMTEYEEDFRNNNEPIYRMKVKVK